MDDTIIYTDGSLEYFRDKARLLERENAALRERLDSVQKSHFTLSKDNAALRAALVNADELERYSGSDGHRQWGKCSAWLHPDDAVIIVSAKALDAARKEAQP